MSALRVQSKHLIFLMKGHLMTNVKSFMIIAMMASTQASYTSYDVQDEAIVLTAKEITLIKTNRILNSFEQVIKSIEATRNWTILSDATVPSRTEQIELAAPLFTELIQNILANYASCYQVTVPTYFGFSEKQELRIINAENSELKIITNKDFLKLLTKAIKFFETEDKEKNYTTNMNIEITLHDGTVEYKNLHDICEAIEKAAA